VTRIQIRVVGDLGGYGHSLFEGFTSMVEPVTTTLVGDVANDDELVVLRHRILDAGLELVSIRELSDEPGGETGSETGSETGPGSENEPRGPEDSTRSG
jgi:hypothetical protein